MDFNMPRTRFVDDENVDLSIQYDKVAGEVLELRYEVYYGYDDRAASEAWDVVQSAQTFLWMLRDRYGVDVEAAKDKVIEGNRERGYYCDGRIL